MNKEIISKKIEEYEIVSNDKYFTFFLGEHKRRNEMYECNYKNEIYYKNLYFGVDKIEITFYKKI